MCVYISQSLWVSGWSIGCIVVSLTNIKIMGKRACLREEQGSSSVLD